MPPVACEVITYSKVWINRARWSILLVVGWAGKIHNFLSPFQSEKLASDKSLAVSSRVSMLILHTQAESGGFLTGFLLPFDGGVVRLFIPPTAIEVSPEFIGSRN